MNSTQMESHEVLDVPTPVLLAVIGGVLSSFCAVTYLLALTMDMLRG